jgi:hypothetical protein
MQILQLRSTVPSYPVLGCSNTLGIVLGSNFVFQSVYLFLGGKPTLELCLSLGSN